MKRLKISEGQPSPSSLGSIYGSVALKEEKHCNSENTEEFSKVQRQIYCKIV